MISKDVTTQLGKYTQICCDPQFFKAISKGEVTVADQMTIYFSFHSNRWHLSSDEVLIGNFSSFLKELFFQSGLVLIPFSVNF